MDGKRRGGLTGRRYLAVALALCAGILLSFSVFLFMRAQERSLLEAGLELHAAKYAALIQDGIDFNLRMVRAAGALYAVSDFVDRHGFETFGDEIRRGRRPGEVQALAWAPRVPDAGRDAFETAARAEGLSGYRIAERDGAGELVAAGRRGEYFPILYLSPLEGRERALGFDIASEAARLGALEMARDSGDKIATGWIVPARERGGQRGVLVLRPVYDSGLRLEGVEARREALKGFVVGLLYIDVLVEAALADFQPVMLNIAINDETAPPERRLLHAMGSPDGRDGDGTQLRLPLEIPGREWSATFAPNPGFFSAHAFRHSRGALGAGLLATALLTFFLAARERDRMRIERAHREWEDAFDAVNDLVFLHDRKGRILRANRAYAERAGMGYRQMVGKPYWEVFPVGDGPLPGCMRDENDGLSGGGEVHDAEIDEAVTDDGTVFLSRAYAVRDDSGSYRYSIHIMEDVTAQRRAEEARHESEARLDSIAATAMDAILMIDDTDRVVYCNRAVERMFGYAPEELVGRMMHETIVPERYRDEFRRGHVRFRESGTGPLVGKVTEVEAIHRDGREIPVELSLSALQLGGRWHAVGIVRDDAERRRLDRELRHINRLLVTLSHANSALVHATSADELLRRICGTIVEDGGFRAASVVRADAGEGMHMAACAGGHCEQVKAVAAVHSLPESDGYCPCMLALRSGRTLVVDDIPDDPGRWGHELREYGCGTVAALPLFSDGEAFATLNVYADQPGTFTPSVVAHLEELAADLSFGLRALRIKGERDEAHGVLGKTLLQTIEAIARIAEMRDPYTAGHQRRVADLAVAIAEELGLDPGRVEGIRVGALVHDIGKIAVPAEILTRPGRLSDIEFEMIKGHPQGGCDIMAGVSFPWPVREMILQHHERLDGSGYPQGLKGDRIIREARILAVADTVEAMSSHRPYRPGRGVEAALGEIERGRGVIYDADAVDACLCLFREKGFGWVEV